jgi:hypothetical protein
MSITAIPTVSSVTPTGIPLYWRRVRSETGNRDIYVYRESTGIVRFWVYDISESEIGLPVADSPKIPS